MENMFLSMLSKVPELAALCFIVRLFLQAMRDRDELIRRLHYEHISQRTLAQV